MFCCKKQQTQIVAANINIYGTVDRYVVVLIDRKQKFYRCELQDKFTNLWGIVNDGNCRQLSSKITSVTTEDNLSSSEALNLSIPKNQNVSGGQTRTYFL